MTHGPALGVQSLHVVTPSSPLTIAHDSRNGCDACGVYQLRVHDKWASK